MFLAAEAFLDFPPERQRGVHLHLLKHALAVWESHYSLDAQPTYVESVAGSCQQADTGLPREALAAVRDRRDTAGVESRYLEPIIALRDEDWVLPHAAASAYYAIYNGFRLHVLGQDIDAWLIVNQALSSLDPGQGVAVLQDAVDDSG
ncbi:hypothetical protein [Achromobacter sp. UMC71]|uniref:hypothetical protein n=1 Tax=Achromobacter sp. UMC71 TaxID=1862320 RepID=UPI0016045719|nr:hypothetical protein [Achromobacter sp. UMC71]MBB1627957.1 hypothetical protein [Achromobacter sp. UMC71]